MNKTAKVIKRVSGLFSIKHLTLYILLMICSLNLQAQATYPVQVYTQLTSPYTPYLPAYYSGINQKLKVTLINTDMQQPTLSVYLRMKIKSSSFTVETPENVYTEHIELQAGVPMQLALDDLAVYFKNENMRISGARNEFLRTQMLPDNFYRFNFEVFEANTNRLVSNPKLGFAQAMIASGEPPILNLPFKGTAIQESNIPSIMFSWTPRHMNSVASAYGTEYEITLVEIFDKQVAPEAAFDYSRPIYTETTRATSFIHTAAQPMLIPGMRYAWRVQAVAREGIEEANVFKNNGYSPISWFDYTVQCDQVQSSGVVVEGRVANVTWTDTGAMNYDVQYRKKGSNKWYAGGIVNDACPIYNLKFGEEYEYKVGVRCTMNDAFTYSDVKGFKMPEELAKNANCGILPNTNISNQTPTRELQAKLPILVGDFPVFITKVSGSGTFSGEGYVGIPYLKNAKIAVTFKDIVVNTDNRLISGFFETKYDISNNNLLWDADETLTGGKGVGDIRTGEEKAQYQVDYTIDSELTKVPIKVDTSEDEIHEGSDAGELTKGENEKYVVTLTDSDGAKHDVVVEKFPATIEDKSGAIYEVDKEGNIKQVSSKSDIVLDDKSKNIQDPIATIVFEEIKDKTKYALDVYNDIYKKVAEFEREYVVEEGKELRASAKFMIPNSSDEIFVRLSKSEAGFDPKNVRFVTENQKEYKGTYNESEKGWSITLVASEAKDGQLLYVVYDKGNKEYGTLAVLKVLTYEPIERHVNIVPVNGFDNGFTQARVEDELNKIYGKVGVTWHVNLVDNFEYAPLANKGLQVTGSGLFATLTDDMKALNDAYTSALGESYSDNDLYLFVIKSSDGGETPEGDMPRGKQFGYLFDGATEQTIAHELGHGAFNLEHPFSRAGRNSFEEGALKENLMDYRSGTRFSKLEWDAISAPGLVIGLFGKDKDGMLSTDVHIAITPDGSFIDIFLNKKTKEPKGVDVVKVTLGVSNVYFIEVIKYENQDYTWSYDDNCYVKDDKKIYPHTFPTSIKENNSNVNIVQRDDGCKYNYAIIKWDGTKKYINASTLNEDIDNIVKTSNAYWYRKPFDYPALSVNCEPFIDDILKRDYSCVTASDNKESDIKLEILLSDIVNANDTKHIVLRLNSEICISSLRKISFDQWKPLFIKITSQETFDLHSCLAILRMMSSLDMGDYVKFISLLNDTKLGDKDLYNHLIVQMTADVLGFFDKADHTTKDFDRTKGKNFLDAMDYIIQLTRDDDELWRFTNKMLYLSLNEVNGISFDANYKRVVISALSVIQQHPTAPSLFISLVESSNTFKKVEDFRVIYDIAIVKADNRQLFAEFTPDFESNDDFLFDRIKKSDWIKGYYVYHSEEREMEEYLVWGKVVREKKNIIDNSSAKTKIDEFFLLFKDEFVKYVSTRKDQNVASWNTMEINCDNLPAIKKLLDSENSESLRKVDSEKRKAIFTLILKEKCAKGQSVESKTYDFDDHVLTKLMKSFSDDISIFTTIESIGLDNIYNQLDGKAFATFYSAIGDVVLSTKRKKDFDADKYYNKDMTLKVSRANLIQLEADLLKLQNVKYDVKGNMIILKGEKYDYFEEVLVNCAGEFTFGGETFREGALLKLPAIKVLAMANGNLNEQIEKGTWLTVDVGLMFLGVGEFKTAFTVGNTLRKALVIGDIAGSTIGIGLQLSDNSTFTPDMRFKLQMVCLALCLPNASTMFKSVNNAVAKLDGFSDLAAYQKAIVRARISSLMSSADAQIITDINKYLVTQDINPSKILNHLDDLSLDELKLLDKDLADIAKLVKKGDETRTMSLWKKYIRANKKSICK